MKYRVLTKEEKKKLVPGMHLAIGTSWGLVRGTYPDLLNSDTHTNLWGGDTLESKTDFADLYVMEDELANQEPENFKLEETKISKGIYQQIREHAQKVSYSKDILDKDNKDD